MRIQDSELTRIEVCKACRDAIVLCNEFEICVASFRWFPTRGFPEASEEDVLVWQKDYLRSNKAELERSAARLRAQLQYLQFLLRVEIDEFYGWDEVLSVLSRALTAFDEAHDPTNSQAIDDLSRNYLDKEYNYPFSSPWDQSEFKTRIEIVAEKLVQIGMEGTQ
ncbi:hypothetical protein ACS3QZ_16020 [Shimia sp. W99]